jgi:protein TonB
LGPETDPGLYEEPATLLVADHMPSFDECVDVLDPTAERQCSEQRIIEYIQSCVEFPQHMRDASISGVVYLEYVVDEFGTVRDARILKSPHPAFNGTVLECIEGLPFMNPGRQQGRPVRVQYTLPVRFSLH